MTRHFLFYDYQSGEEFIVGAADLYDARMTAEEVFGDDIKYCYEMTDDEAEMSGLDEY
jgi:hypothetical protein